MKLSDRTIRMSAVISLVLALLPGVASACAVCFTGKEDDTRIAFGLMTAFMTVMPFVICGGVLWWLRGRLKEIEAMHERAREADTAIAAHARTPLSSVSAVERCKRDRASLVSGP